MLEAQIRKNGILFAVIIAKMEALNPDSSATWEANIFYADGCKPSRVIANARMDEGELGALKRIMQLEIEGKGERI